MRYGMKRDICLKAKESGPPVLMSFMLQSIMYAMFCLHSLLYIFLGIEFLIIFLL